MIPDLTPQGFLPLFLPPYPSNDAAKQSPYTCSIEELRTRFAVGETRSQMFKKLEIFRAELRLFGITQGFQIFGGSFVSNKPDPRDIDVVTCFQRPARWATREIAEQDVAANPQIFSRADVKQRLACDVNFVDLGWPAPVAASAISRWVLRYSSEPPDPPTRFKGVLFVDLASDAK